MHYVFNKHVARGIGFIAVLIVLVGLYFIIQAFREPELSTFSPSQSVAILLVGTLSMTLANFIHNASKEY